MDILESTSHHNNTASACAEWETVSKSRPAYDKHNVPGEIERLVSCSQLSSKRVDCSLGKADVRLLLGNVVYVTGQQNPSGNEETGGAQRDAVPRLH